MTPRPAGSAALEAAIAAARRGRAPATRDLTLGELYALQACTNIDCREPIARRVRDALLRAGATLRRAQMAEYAYLSLPYPAIAREP